MTVVLSPDRAKFWDGSTWQEAALVSEDGRSVWDGSSWYEIAASSARKRSERSAIVWSYAICAAIAAPLIIVGTALESTGFKALFDGLASLPLLGIHALKDSLVEGKLKAPSPSGVVRSITHISPRQWLIAGAAYGGLLALFDNSLVLLLAWLFGTIVLVFAFAAPVALGAWIGSRRIERGWRILIPMAYVASFVNSNAFTLAGGNNTLGPLGAFALNMALGVPIGGTFLLILGLAGYGGVNLWRRLRAPAPTVPAALSPHLAPTPHLPPHILSPDQTHFWDGHAWQATSRSPDGAWVWDGVAWQAAIPSAPAAPLTPAPAAPSPPAN